MAQTNTAKLAYSHNEYVCFPRQTKPHWVFGISSDYEDIWQLRTENMPHSNKSARSL